MEFDFFFFLFQPLSLRLLASIYIYVQLFFNCHRINKKKNVWSTQARQVGKHAKHAKHVKHVI